MQTSKLINGYQKYLGPTVTANRRPGKVGKIPGSPNFLRFPTRTSIYYFVFFIAGFLDSSRVAASQSSLICSPIGRNFDEGFKKKIFDGSKTLRI